VNPTPVVLFVHKRPTHVARILECLREDRVPLLIVFSDAAAKPQDLEPVERVRALVRAVDWTEVQLHESTEHRGLGTSIRRGVARSFEDFESLIVLEDDLVFTPGTYAFLTAGLHQYRDVLSVMSLTAWTHPRITPADVGTKPYFDGRAECWSWATWRRCWDGMETPAADMVLQAKRKNIDITQYGSDLPRLAAQEVTRNTWASRWLLLHLLRDGLCLRPAWSMVDHEPSEDLATNVRSDWSWAQQLRGAAPPLPRDWPPPEVHPQVSQLWKTASQRSRLQRLLTSVRAGFTKTRR
jgi:hypothetical protein